jgi:hypothetical protein
MSSIAQTLAYRIATLEVRRGMDHPFRTLLFEMFVQSLWRFLQLPLRLIRSIQPVKPRPGS